MKWFFLPFIPLLGIAGNLALLSEPTAFRLLGAIPFNLFVLSLASIWWHTYFQPATLSSRALTATHAALFLSVGMAIALTGVNITLSESCSPLITSDRSRGFISSTARLIEAIGYCRQLGVALALLGVILAYPSVRLVYSLRRGDTYRLPSKHEKELIEVNSKWK
jgi:hypothetical protein